MTGKKHIVIISPHFPPSNLVGVHRNRLLAKYLPQNGYDTTVIAVKEKYYEEDPDYNLSRLIPEWQKIIKINAFRAVKRFRLIGDIGLRSYFQYIFAILKLHKNHRIDLLIFSIPSFYLPLIGRTIYQIKKIPYCVDYRDPWVHSFPGSEKKLSRAWWSKIIASKIEPWGIKKASYITAVSQGYIDNILKRNPFFQKRMKFAAITNSFDPEELKLIENIPQNQKLFEKQANKIKLMYAGALPPDRIELLKYLFKILGNHKEELEKLEIHFIGTCGNIQNSDYTIKNLAEQQGLWKNIIFEYPIRQSYTDILHHLKISDGIFVIGSSDVNYTPSKIYQAILFQKPILAFLHRESSIIQILEKSNAGKTFSFSDDESIIESIKIFMDLLTSFSCKKEFVVEKQADAMAKHFHHLFSNY